MRSLNIRWGDKNGWSRTWGGSRSVLGVKHQKFWNFLINYEQKLFTQLGTLEDGVQQRIPASLKEKFLPELEAIAQTTSNIFNYIANADRRSGSPAISPSILTGARN
ncbi:hypothetical protein AB0758_48575 [Tolypothrix bouteillei VB521301_2]|uniref:hypothetical protein n=1 Tax=Tolypothrix bouteillei TaxID=1246981 RepID=UPI0038B656A0